MPTQSGTTPVEIPLGSECPVIGTGKALGLIAGNPNNNIVGYELCSNTGTANNVMFQQRTAGLASGTNNYEVGYTVPESEAVSGNRPASRNQLVGVSTSAESSGLKALLTQATGAPLEGLYQAVAYNTYQYMTSRGGNRYFEHVSNVYGVVNPDGVLQQPEFLGSLSQMIDFDVVTQTSSTSGEATPLANRAANGYMENFGSLINKSFGEFGWIIIYGVITYYPKYQQGVSKLMQTSDPLELFNPIFNLMGDEAIYRGELYTQSDSVVNSDGLPVNEEVFGYGKRNSRLLYPVNEIHGEQRSTYSSSLDTNHFAEEYTQAPTLNKTFDKVTDEGFKRALMVQNETQFICNSIITGTNDIEIPLEAIPSIVPMQTGIA